MRRTQPPADTASAAAWRTIAAVMAIYVAWIGAWLLKLSLDRHGSWSATPRGGFEYWTAMKVLLWVLPSVAIIHRSGRRVSDVLALDRLRGAMVWGIGAGFVAAAVSLATKAIQHKPLLSPTLSWAFVTAVVVAPLFEEFMFRGAVLGVLAARYRFTAANVLTSALFLGMHLPGWYFQGRLFRLLLAPVGGALYVFLFGFVIGFVRRRSGSVVAAMLTHAFNNFCA